MARKPKKPLDTGKIDTPLQSMLLGMEPPLRQIEGILALLTILGQATEPVEPAALAVLARAGQSAHDELSLQWHQALAAVKTG